MDIDASQLFEQHENILTDASDNMLIDAHRHAPETRSISDSEGSASDVENMHAGGSSSFRRPTYGKGTSWDHRKPPSELQAMDALDEIQSLLRPIRPGKQKRYMESKIEAWGKKVLKELKAFLNLFTGANSKVKGQWMEAHLSAYILKLLIHAQELLREWLLFLKSEGTQMLETFGPSAKTSSVCLAKLFAVVVACSSMSA